jgi:GNAT superfamily N-acetyltransferase
MNLRKETTDNLFDFYLEIASLAKLSRGELQGIPYVKNVLGTWPNFILGGNIIHPDELNKMADAMKKGDVPSTWIRDIEVQKNFEDLALKRGIRQVNQWTGMSFQLNKMSSLSAGRSDIGIARIIDHADIDAWGELVNREILNSKILDSSLIHILNESENFHLFGLWNEDNRLVSTTLIFAKNEVGGIYFVATDKNERGKGYAFSLVSYAINYCISNRIYKFVLHSTQLGIPLYQKLGFKENTNYGIYWMLGKRD